MFNMVNTTAYHKATHLECMYACTYVLIQVHCCVTMMNWQGIELIAQH